MHASRLLVQVFTGFVVNNVALVRPAGAYLHGDIVAAKRMAMLLNARWMVMASLLACTPSVIQPTTIVERPTPTPEAPAVALEPGTVSSVPRWGSPMPLPGEVPRWIAGGVRFEETDGVIRAAADALACPIRPAIEGDNGWLFVCGSSIWRSDSFMGALELAIEGTNHIFEGDGTLVVLLRGEAFVSSGGILEPIADLRDRVIVDISLEGMDGSVRDAVGEVLRTGDGGRSWAVGSGWTPRSRSHGYRQALPRERDNEVYATLLGAALRMHPSLGFVTTIVEIDGGWLAELNNELWHLDGEHAQLIDRSDCRLDVRTFPFAKCEEDHVAFDVQSLRWSRIPLHIPDGARSLRSQNREHILFDFGCEGTPGMSCLVHVSGSSETLPRPLPFGTHRPNVQTVFDGERISYVRANSIVRVNVHTGVSTSQRIGELGDNAHWQWSWSGTAIAVVRNEDEPSPRLWIVPPDEEHTELALPAGMRWVRGIDETLLYGLQDRHFALSQDGGRTWQAAAEARRHGFGEPERCSATGCHYVGFSIQRGDVHVHGSHDDDDGGASYSVDLNCEYQTQRPHELGLGLGRVQNGRATLNYRWPNPAGEDVHLQLPLSGLAEDSYTRVELVAASTSSFIFRRCDERCELFMGTRGRSRRLDVEIILAVALPNGDYLVLEQTRQGLVLHRLDATGNTQTLMTATSLPSGIAARADGSAGLIYGGSQGPRGGSFGPGPRHVTYWADGRREMGLVEPAEAVVTPCPTSTENATRWYLFNSDFSRPVEIVTIEPELRCLRALTSHEEGSVLFVESSGTDLRGAESSSTATCRASRQAPDE